MTNEHRIRLSFAAVAACAGAVHLLIAPHHLAEGSALGAAFMLDGLAFLAVGASLAAGVAVARPFAGALGLATASAYLLSRTIGLPWLEHHHQGIDILGAITTAGELGLAFWGLSPAAIAIWRLRGLGPLGGSRRKALTALASSLVIVVVSAVMAPANVPPLPVAPTAQPSSSPAASPGAEEPDLETAKPPGCVAINRRMNLYAEQIASTQGTRLGYGTAPGKASIPGPFIELEEGDCIAITLTNNVPRETLESLRFDGKTPIGVSLHVHGVKYTPASDGTAHHRSFVGPGESRTFIWYAAPRVTVDGRVVSLGTAGYWWYHDHVVGSTHGTSGLEAGLFGGMVVRRKGDIRPDRTHTVVMGPNATINLQRNPAPFTATEGERVEFVVLNVGDDFHTFHLHAHNWADNRTGFLRGPTDETQLIDAKTIGPSESFGFQVIAGEQVGAGSWMLHCHVQSHSDRGMATFFQVNRADGVPLPSAHH